MVPTVNAPIKLNFNLVKDAIENAKQSNNFDTLDHFEYFLSELLRKM